MPALTNTFKLNLITATDYCVESSEPLLPGQLLVLLPSETIAAVIRRVDNTRCYLATPTSNKPVKTDTGVAFYNWWQQQQPPASSRLVSPLFFVPADDLDIAELIAIPSKLQRDQRPGSLGWDLWYCPTSNQPWLHVLKGHDDASYMCTFAQLSVKWPPGCWLFKATLFYKTNLVPIATSQYAFKTIAPQSTFRFTFQLS
jgi:hypothetical protein